MKNWQRQGVGRWLRAGLGMKETREGRARRKSGEKKEEEKWREEGGGGKKTSSKKEQRGECK